MYDDNAWPDTAPITVFIAERRRPKRVDVAAYALGVAAAAHLLVSALYGTAVDKAPEAVVLSADVPTWLMIVVSATLALVTATAVVGLIRGRRWAPLTARVTGGVYGAACGVFGLSAMPPSGTTGAGFAWFYAIVGFIVAVAGVVGLVALTGSSVAEYFAPRQQPSSHAPTGPDVQPLGGYDRDWIPPTQGRPEGAPQQPPYPPYGG